MTDEPTDQIPPALGDYSQIPSLNLSGMTAEQVLEALPEPTPEQLQAWLQSLNQIRAATMVNTSARLQVASVLASVSAIARSVGLILTVA